MHATMLIMRMVVISFIKNEISTNTDAIIPMISVVSISDYKYIIKALKMQQ